MNSTYTLDEIIELGGYIPFDLVAYQFGVTIMGALSILLCTVNAWIFFRKSFSTPADDYLKLICLVGLSESLLSVPYGFCITPKYFPSMDSYKCSIVQTVYISFSEMMFHYTGILEIAILLERMKIFSKIVKKYFTIVPKRACILFFLVCIPIDGFFASILLPKLAGDFYYVDKGEYKQNTYFYVGVTDFANTEVGKMLLISVYVVRDVFTMLTSLALNIVSLIQMRAYFKKKSRQLLQNSAGINAKATKHEIKLRNTEKNHLLMVITLCFIAIISRTVLIMSNIYYLYTLDYVTVLMGTLADLVIIFGPFSSFFVFFKFNKKFRNEFFAIFCIFRDDEEASTHNPSSNTHGTPKTHISHIN